MWKAIAKKASFTRKGSAASSNLGRDGGGVGGNQGGGGGGGLGGGGVASVSASQGKALEKKGSAVLGPFSFDEFGQLQHLFS